jgi:hypothetical protein
MKYLLGYIIVTQTLESFVHSLVKRIDGLETH